MSKAIWQSIFISSVFLFVPQVLTWISITYDPVYLPFIALALGASAITIGIQQSYIAIKLQDKGQVYQWGAICLVGFGIYSLLQIFNLFNTIPTSYIYRAKQIEMTFLILAFGALFRAVSAYFYFWKQNYISWR